jgi:hypothetical protein
MENNVSQCHLVHHKSYMDWPWIDPDPHFDPHFGTQFPAVYQSRYLCNARYYMRVPANEVQAFIQPAFCGKTSNAEDSSRLERDAASLGDWFPTFRRNVVPPCYRGNWSISTFRKKLSSYMVKRLIWTFRTNLVSSSYRAKRFVSTFRTNLLSLSFRTRGSVRRFERT